MMMKVFRSCIVLTLMVVLASAVSKGAFLKFNQLARKVCAAGITATIGSASISTVALADAIPSIGTVAPDFTLPSNTGKDLSLKDFSGKRTVLYFYPGDFTSGCTIEAQGFERDISKYKDLNVQIAGVSVDSKEKHLDFAKTYGLEFPLLSDQGGKSAILTTEIVMI